MNLCLRNCSTPIIFWVLHGKHQTIYIIFLPYIFACLRLRFLDVETNPGLLRPVPDVCRILCCNVRSLIGNLSDLTFDPVWYTVVLWDFIHRYASRVGVAGSRIWLPVLLCRCKMPRALWMAAYIRDCYGVFRANKNLSVVIAKCWFFGFVVWDRTRTCSVFISTLT